MSTLVGSAFGVALPRDKAPKAVESVILHIADSSYLFDFSESKQMWQTEFVAPATPGVYQAVLSINFIDQTSGAINWQLQTLPYGQVYEKSAGQKKPLAGAIVSLFQQGQLWSAFSFYQNNPQTIGADGVFGFLVLPGEYLLEIKKDGYATEKISISIAGAVINSSVELLYLPPAIKDVIKSGASLTENVLAVTQNLGEKSKFISKKVWKEAKEVANNPEVQKAAEEVAAPVVASAVAVGTTAVVGWAQLFGYLRFLFTQPALLFKRRKRHGWGVVYNSLTKLPLDLVIVRLVNVNSGKVVQTRVTDSHGRYVFFPAIGLAAGACSGNGIVLDISDPVHPARIDDVIDPSFAYWHSASFNNDGTKVIFTDEWGGGTQPRCRATDPLNWGADAIFTLANRRLKFGSYYKMPAAQTDRENCVAHNGSLIPIPGRDVMVQAWYQGGISVFDWTDPKSPKEIAFFDRGPVDSTRMASGGTWSAYWYNGVIVSSEISRGLDVLELTPSALLSQNEIDAARSVRFDHLNVQGQQRYVWPPTFALARAYLDQLERSQGLSAARISAIRHDLHEAEEAAGDGRRERLTRLATRLQTDAASAADAAKVTLLAGAVRDLAK